MAARYRRLFIEGLARSHKADKLRFFGDLEKLTDPEAFAAHLAPLHKINWAVYAKPPFGWPEAVLAHLSRYTLRVAISNHRVVSKTLVVAPDGCYHASLTSDQ